MAEKEMPLQLRRCAHTPPFGSLNVGQIAKQVAIGLSTTKAKVEFF